MLPTSGDTHIDHCDVFCFASLVTVCISLCSMSNDLATFVCAPVFYSRLMHDQRPGPASFNLVRQVGQPEPEPLPTRQAGRKQVPLSTKLAVDGSQTGGANRAAAN